MLVKYTDKDLDQLARLMRAEAVGEGELGMLMVGNVIVNRTIAGCLTFKDNKSVSDAIFQTPGGFAGINSDLFDHKSTTAEKELATRVLRGEYYYPATNALWFYAPRQGENCVPTWYDQRLVGRYKTHCFYQPASGVCKEIH